MNGVLLGVYEKALITPSDWPSFFAQVREAGFDFVDLSIDESPHRAQRLDWTLDECRQVRQAAESHDVAIGGLCLSLHRRVMPGSCSPVVRAEAADVFRRAIDLARHLAPVSFRSPATTPTTRRPILRPDHAISTQCCRPCHMRHAAGSSLASRMSMATISPRSAMSWRW